MAEENYGKIVQVIGPTVDCEFPSNRLPNIYNAIKIRNEEKGIELTAEVAMHIGDNIVRCIALASTDGLVRGMPALDTGAPISVPVGRGWSENLQAASQSSPPATPTTRCEQARSRY